MKAKKAKKPAKKILKFKTYECSGTLTIEVEVEGTVEAQTKKEAEKFFKSFVERNILPESGYKDGRGQEYIVMNDWKRWDDSYFDVNLASEDYW